MKVDEVCKKHGIPKAASVLKKFGITKLYPPQADAIKKGVLDGKNFVLAIPTAAGKTLVAELCMLKSILSEGGRCLYTVPLRALASEKYDEFREKYEPLGVKIGIATGDYDKADPHLAKYDIIIATSEKVDSLLRHRAKWLADVISVVVFDEIHLINDPGRGPTLEVLAARLKQVNPELQVLALSATIRNSGEVADWLGAELTTSEWRPVPLKEGVYHAGKIWFSDESERPIKAPAKDKVGKLATDTVQGGGQALVFVSTRRSTQVAARKAARGIRALLSKEEREQLKKVAGSIETTLGESTRTCRQLADCVRQGTAFHHAGLHYTQRKLIEDAFKRNLIKVVCATPTLAAGVNLPARRAIIRDYQRYTPPFGMQPIPVLEYKQMCLPYDSEVLLDDGSILPIGEIVERKLQKRVLAYDGANFRPERILKHIKRKSDKLVAIRTNAPNPLKLTPEHPILAKRNGRSRWILAGKIKKGDEIAHYCEKKEAVAWQKVQGVRIQGLDPPVPVYNLQIDTDETYVASNFVLHNCGRAGRPKYDEHGEAVLIAKTDAEREVLLEEFVLAEPERITSKLASEPALRAHILASIAAGYVKSLEGMLDFINHTFFAHQYSASRVESIVERVLDFLEGEGMVSTKGKWLSATRFGKRVSQLYIDPLSGVVLRDGLEDVKSKEATELGLLHLICHTPDMGTLYLRRRDYSDLDLVAKDHAEEFLAEVPDEELDPEGYEFFLAEVKTSRMLQAWLEEISEDHIHERFGVGAGDIRRNVDTAEWLLYASHELAKLFKVKRAYAPLRKLRQRVRYGIKEELLELVSLRGIGRVRARSLFNAGYRKLKDLERASARELARVKHIGPETAKSIKQQIK